MTEKADIVGAGLKSLVEPLSEREIEVLRLVMAGFQIEKLPRNWSSARGRRKHMSTIYAESWEFVIVLKQP